MFNIHPTSVRGSRTAALIALLVLTLASPVAVQAKKKKPEVSATSGSSDLAGWTGLEPAASGVTGRRYNQA